MSADAPDGRPLHAFLIAGEASGDALGAALIPALRALAGPSIQLGGVGGTAMAAAGLPSLFPIDDLAIVGFSAVPRRLPAILRRIQAAADAVIAARPDVLVIIDSPDFTHRVARRVRARAPEIAIVDYVSPSVWAWRPWRARAMRRYVDHVLALLPFEPEVHKRLGGPPCTYVGHPLIEQVPNLRPNADEARRRDVGPPVLLVLPGSRRGEIRRLIEPFGAAVEQVAAQVGPIDVVLPTVPHVRELVAGLTASWSPRPRIIDDPDAKRAAFRTARAALAASGTVTLELALAGVPTVAAYRVTLMEEMVARLLIRVRSVVLANLVLGENVVPEFLQRECTPARLADALLPLIADTPSRRRQLDAFARLDAIMEIGEAAPSRRAAEAIMAVVAGRYRRREIGR